MLLELKIVYNSITTQKNSSISTIFLGIPYTSLFSWLNFCVLCLQGCSRQCVIQKLYFLNAKQLFGDRLNVITGTLKQRGFKWFWIFQNFLFCFPRTAVSSSGFMHDRVSKDNEGFACLKSCPISSRNETPLHTKNVHDVISYQNQLHAKLAQPMTSLN